VLFRVTTQKPVRTLFGQTGLVTNIAFSFDASHKSWFALAGASLETKPGTYIILLRGETFCRGDPPGNLPDRLTGRPSRSKRKFVSNTSAILGCDLNVPGRLYRGPAQKTSAQIEQDKGNKGKTLF